MSFQKKGKQIINGQLLKAAVILLSMIRFEKLFFFIFLNFEWATLLFSRIL